jgi:hypothetical protein
MLVVPLQLPLVVGVEHEGTAGMGGTSKCAIDLEFCRI